MKANIPTLQSLIERINTATNSPATPYTRIDGKLTANIGNFHLSQAQGGVCVHRMANDAGGVTTPIWHGHIIKKEAEAKMRAFLAGLEFRS